jgi:hypothetical protein
MQSSGIINTPFKNLKRNLQKKFINHRCFDLEKIYVDNDVKIDILKIYKIKLA